ncbi:MAG: putative nickel-responsive regulator [Syntrophorhabdus sp. PtaU1.Bin058]|nr:MAG: putative nickel-responsive regulator [Syntrophorhabdus sp. PtaU1.Bin058]
MTDLFRFGISVEKELIEEFDACIRKKNYANRSEAFRDLIRQELIREEWAEGDEVVGAIILLYNHHRKDLLSKITTIQHDHQNLIISTQHIHLDRDDCLEIVAVRGEPVKVQWLADRLKALKGVKHGTLAMSSTGHALGDSP